MLTGLRLLGELVLVVVGSMLGEWAGPLAGTRRWGPVRRSGLRVPGPESLLAGVAHLGLFHVGGHHLNTVFGGGCGVSTWVTCPGSS